MCDYNYSEWRTDLITLKKKLIFLQQLELSLYLHKDLHIYMSNNICAYRTFY